MTEIAIPQPPLADEPARRRIVRIAAWLVGILVVLVALRLAGIDVWGWFVQLWHTVTDIALGYVILGCVLQCAQTALTALGWYGILRYAYPGGVTYLTVLACYATGVALNGVVPANLGTFVMLLMFVAVVAGATFPGILAGYAVQKIFYLVIGTLIYVYLFSQVTGSFDFQFGDERDAVIEPRRPDAAHHRRGALPDRRARAHLLALGAEDVGEGEGGRGHPRRPARVREVGPPAADGRLCREGRA